jgi:hypothetical protein
MASERGFDRDVCGFFISNFANQDDFWILTQKRTECGSES